MIAIGEIRDKTTAEIALQAALTGHLILTTFHAGSACEVIGRFLDMGIEPYVVRSGLRAVVAQRLVRRLCDCAIASSRPDDFLGLPVRHARLPRGCDACRGTGYLGRAVLAEMLLPETEELARAVLALRRRPPARAGRRRRRHDRSLGARLRGRRARTHVSRRGPPHPGRRHVPGADPCSTFVNESVLTSSDNCGEILVIQMS